MGRPRDAIKHVRELASRWQIRFTDASREPKEVSFSFEKDSFGRREIQDLRDELRYLWQKGQWDPWNGELPGAPSEREPLGLLKAIEGYCAHKRALGERGLRGGWSERTHRNYQIDLEAFARLAGAERPVRELQEADFSRWIFDTPTQATHQTRRRMLKTFLGYLKAEGHVEEDLSTRLPRPFLTRVTISDYFTEPEVASICRAHVRLCNAATSKPKVPKKGPNSPLAQLWMVDAWWLLFYQGFRRGELMALRTGAVDLRRWLVHVGDKDFIPKGKDEALVTITPPARAYCERLAAQAAAAGGRSAYLVRPGSRSKSARENLAQRLSAAFKAALQAAIESDEVPIEKGEMSLHNLRDSCCQFWIDRGVPERDVQELLRHKSVATTRRHYKSVNARRQTEQFEANWLTGKATL